MEMIDDRNEIQTTLRYYGILPIVYSELLVVLPSFEQFPLQPLCHFTWDLLAFVARRPFSVVATRSKNCTSSVLVFSPSANGIRSRCRTSIASRIRNGSTWFTAVSPRMMKAKDQATNRSENTNRLVDGEVHRHMCGVYTKIHRCHSAALPGYL